MQRGRLVLILGCRVGAVFDEEPRQIPCGCVMQWSRTVLVLH